MPRVTKQTNAACAPPGQGQGCRIRKAETALGLSNRRDSHKQLMAQMSQQLRSQIGMTKPPGLSHSGSCCRCWDPRGGGASLGIREELETQQGLPARSQHLPPECLAPRRSLTSRKGSREGEGQADTKACFSPRGPTSVPAETRQLR